MAVVTEVRIELMGQSYSLVVVAVVVKERIGLVLVAELPCSQMAAAAVAVEEEPSSLEAVVVAEPSWVAVRIVLVR